MLLHKWTLKTLLSGMKPVTKDYLLYDFIYMEYPETGIFFFYRDKMTQHVIYGKGRLGDDT